MTDTLDAAGLEAAAAVGFEEWNQHASAVGDHPFIRWTEGADQPLWRMVFGAAIRAYLAATPSVEALIAERNEALQICPKWAARQAATQIEALEAENAALKARVGEERRRATNAEYMAVAYRNMLGKTGRKVAAMWAENGVKRAHFDWGPSASDMTGEQRAQFILDLENAPRREIRPGELDARPALQQDDSNG